MTDKRTIQIIAGGLVVIVVVGIIGLFILLRDIASSDKVFDPTLLVGFTSLTSGALGGLIGLLGNTSSVDPGAIADSARTQALSDVAALDSPPPAHLKEESPPLVVGGILPEPDYGIIGSEPAADVADI